MSERNVHPGAVPPAGTIHPSGMAGDPRRIWLQPVCCAEPDLGRLWCEHDEPVECPDARPWTEYVRVTEGDPRWYVILDEDGEIVAEGTRAWLEGYLADEESAEPGYTLHGVYIGPEMEVRDG